MMRLSSSPRLKSTLVKEATVSASYGRVEERMRLALERRVAAGTLRSVDFGPKNVNVVDFASNDYLGYARDRALSESFLLSELDLKEGMNGSSGSRLLTGGCEAHDDFERWLAKFHGRESALLFTSGYAANSGVAACLATADDAVFFDELSHSSTRFGLARGRQKVTRPFKHNDAEDLRRQIKELRQKEIHSIFVYVESVYSMDGDAADLKAIAKVCRDEGDSCIVVDEAHATGVIGSQGRGAVSEANVEDVVLCSVHTFGKAIGCHGACVVSSSTLKSYLSNYAQPLIYATALPASASRLAARAYGLAAGPDGDRRRAHLATVNHALRIGLADVARRHPDVHLLPSASAIHGLVVPGAPRVLSVAKHARKLGFDLRPIRAPTVKAGSERLRIVAHAHNTLDDAQRCLQAIDQALALSPPPPPP